MTAAELAKRVKVTGRRGSWYDALCPGHEDHRPSFSFRDGDARVIVKCRARCSEKQIAAGLGIKVKDFFFITKERRNGQGRLPLTLDGFAAAKRLPIEFLAAQGVKQESWGLLITYYERDGRPAKQQRRRTSVTARSGSKWLMGAGSPIPYGRWHLDEAMEQGEMLLVEGESDTLTAWFHNVPALGIPGADMAKVLTPEDLRGIDRLYIVQEPGKGGKVFIASLARRLQEIHWRGQAYVVRLPVKDINDLHVQRGERFADDLVSARAAATPLHEWTSAGPESAADLQAAEDQATPLLPVTPSVNGEAADGPCLIETATIIPKPIDWIWPGRLARGKLTLLVGEPDLGKSLIGIDHAARLSRGMPWPDRSPSPTGRTIIMTSEDGIEDTVVPRLIAAGADLTRVHVLRMARRNGVERMVTLTEDLDMIEQALRADGTTLLIIDPMSAYLGDTDSHRDAALRGVLTPFADLLDRAGVAGLGIMHPPKSVTNVIYYASGSGAFTAQARVVLGVGRDPNDDSDRRRLVVKIKSNLAREVGTLAYCVEECDGAPVLAWDAVPLPGVTARDILGLSETQDERADRRSAVKFLRTLLRDGPMSAQEVYLNAKENGFSERTIDRAKRDLGVISDKVGRPGTEGQAWVWAMPSKDAQ